MLIDAVAPKQIKTLNLRDNAFGPIGVQQFKDYLQNTQHLQSLNISNCGISAEAAETLSEALRANENIKLTDLKMCRNRISDGGAKAMALYFQSYDTLQ